jgi:hypothetical protein
LHRHSKRLSAYRGGAKPELLIRGYDNDFTHLIAQHHANRAFDTFLMFYILQKYAMLLAYKQRFEVAQELSIELIHQVRNNDVVGIAAPYWNVAAESFSAKLSSWMAFHTSWLTPAAHKWTRSSRAKLW